MKKKSAIVMIIIYLVLIPVKGYCEAGTLVVAGGSIATGGLALAGTPITVPVLAAIGVGLTACGLNIELTRASQEAGLTKTQFILQKLEEYRVSADKSLEDINNTIANGVSVTKDGTILLSNQASKQIKQFGNWLFANDMVISGTANEGIYMDNYKLVETKQLTFSFIGTPGTSPNVRYRYAFSSGKVYSLIIHLTSGTEVCCFISPVYFTQSSSESGVNSRGATKYGNIYAYNLQSWDTSIGSSFVSSTPELIVQPVPFSTFESWANSLSGIITEGGTNIDTFIGDKTEWDEKSTNLNPTNGQTAIDPELLDKIITTVGSGFVGVNDYLRSIADAIDGIAGSIPITDGDTGTVTTGDVPITDSVPTIDVSEADPPVNPDPDTPDGKTPLVDPNTPANGTSAIDPLKLPLKSFFPFCIPFDVKDMVSKLSASPVAPSYHVHWFVPIVNQYLDFTVDLSGFNSVASIARKMELLAFVVGLAIVTRSMFIRG